MRPFSAETSSKGLKKKLGRPLMKEAPAKLTREKQLESELE